MEFKFKYLEALEKHNLNLSDLNEDAQMGVKQIEAFLKNFKMAEAKGQTISDDAIKKVNALDKWVYYEILDHVDGTNKNQGPPTPIQGQQAQAQAQQVIESEPNNAEAEKAKKLGQQIDGELKAMHASGHAPVWELDEIKRTAPATYDTIFNTYTEGGENGVNTTFYSIIETEPKKFTLTKK